MKLIFAVALREIRVMLRRGSFYVATFAIPVITGAIVFGSALLSASFGPRGAPSDPGDAVQPAGLIDQAGVVRTIPFELHQYFVPYPDEAAAAAALRNGAIDSYFVIAPDYLQTGQVVAVSREVSLTGAAPNERLLSSVLRANLLGDPQVAARLDAPLELATELTGGGTAPERTGQPLLDMGLSFALAFLLAFSILNGSGWLVQAVAEEKENRTIELVLTSLRPWQLMTGKILGLGAVSLLQLTIWMAIGSGLLGIGSAVGRIEPGALPPGVWLWVVVFFVLGFLFFGALMAAMGAVGASVRESGQMSSVLTIPMLMPLWFGSALTDRADSTLALVLGLIPVTAPVTMMLRLGEGSVPLWQLLSSVAVLTLSVVGAIWLAARLFRSSTLLTGVRPTPRALWQALRG